MSGGAVFSPCLSPRPEYPEFLYVLKTTVLNYATTSIFGALAVIAVHPKYLDVVNYLLITKGLTERWVFTILFCTIHTICYVLICGFYLYCDYTGFLNNYKLTRKRWQVPTAKLITKTTAEAVIGKIFINPFTWYHMYKLYKYFGMPSLTAPLPGFESIVAAMAFTHFFNHIVFYWAHRALHHPLLYGRIHKQHHRYNGTVSVAAEYASPLEVIFSNILPSVGGCLFFGCHGSVLILFVFIAIRLQESYESHSGYCFHDTILQKIGLTNSKQAAFHDFHHTGNCGNFGFIWTDYLFGTMDSYVKLGMKEGYIKKMAQNVEAEENSKVE
jgi:methylsterol monooxygenase